MFRGVVAEGNIADPVPQIPLVDGAVVCSYLVTRNSYGEWWRSKLTEVNDPRDLAVDREGRVIVADEYNNRLLVIDESLSSAHEMSVGVDKFLSLH